MRRRMQGKSITWTDILAIGLRSVIVLRPVITSLVQAGNWQKPCSPQVIDVVSASPPGGDASCTEML